MQQSEANDSKLASRKREETLSKDGQWRSFPNVPCLRQYVSNGNYYGRIRVNGKLIRTSLKTNVWSTAKLRLAELTKGAREERGKVLSPKFSEALEIYERELKADTNMKPRSKGYRLGRGGDHHGQTENGDGMHKDSVVGADGNNLMAFDLLACVEEDHRESLPFGVIIGIRGDVHPPISGGLVWRVAKLHLFRRGAFPQRGHLVFVGLRGEPERLHYLFESRKNGSFILEHHAIGF